MSRRIVPWSIAVAMFGVLALPAAAAADDLIVIPVSGFARGDEGDVISIATVAVPEDVVGATCQITGSTVNQISVHEGNDLLIITGGQTFVVPNFEDAGFITHEAGETAAVGSTIELQIRFGPDGVSSGGFRVSLDCDPVEEPPTTTVTTVEEPPAGPTTAPPSTEPATTIPPTSTPATSADANPPTTLPEEPPAGPTTEPLPETTSTTTPPSTEPATTAPPTSTPPTSAAANPPTTAAEEPPAGPSADGGGALPITGSSTGLIVGFGVAFVAAGMVLRRLGTAAA